MKLGDHVPFTAPADARSAAERTAMILAASMMR